MDPLLLARWQFAITTVYHFFFVPLTLGLALLVAIMETIYVRTGDETWKRMTKFWGKLFLINFAMGVATGIVQEFQFGMNWSEYSKYVGDIFGAPLAIEATAAFFLVIVAAGLRAQRGRVTTGAQGLVGLTAVVTERLAPGGRVRLRGEYWNAVSGTPLEPGTEVEITGVDGLLLRVRPLAKEA